MRQSIISISIADKAWSRVPRLRALARNAVTQTLAQTQHPHPKVRIALAIRFAGDTEVADLNQRWRGKSQATNVLSFPAAPQPGEMMHLGDVILAFGVVAAEASDQGKSIEAHTAHLIVHGVLHLLGFDHQAKDEASRMEEAEIAILARMGYENPYILA